MYPLVSILIPVYNRERLVVECIESAQSQTYPNIEIVVCDNASTDGTWEAVSEIARSDSRVRPFRNESNVGPVHNWLRCLAESRGEYIKILFSDDLIAPTYIERLLPYLKNPDVAFAYCTAFVGATADTGFTGYRPPGGTMLISTEDYFDWLSCGQAPYSPAAAIFRLPDTKQNLRDSFPTRTPQEFSKHGAGPDVLLYALTACDYPVVAVIDEPLVMFRIHSGSITTSNSDNSVAQGYRAALSWFYATHRSHSEWATYLARQWVSLVKQRRRWFSVSRLSRIFEGRAGVRDSVAILSRVGWVIGTKVTVHARNLLGLTEQIKSGERRPW